MYKHYQVNKTIYLHFYIVFKILPEIYCISTAPSTQFYWFRQAIGFDVLKLPQAS